MGDSATNLEVLPPLGRPKSRIVEVEIPYATKLLSQEMECFMNISTRYITTSEVTRFPPMEGADQSEKELIPILEYPELEVPEEIIENKDDELVSLQESLAKEREELDVIRDELENEEIIMDTELPDEPINPQIVVNIAQPMQPMQPQPEVQLQPMQPLQPEVQLSTQPLPSLQTQPLPSLQLQPQTQPLPQLPFAQLGGDGLIQGYSTPQSGPVIAIGTSADDFARDGIMMGGRRSTTRYMSQMQMPQMQMPQMQMPQMQMPQTNSDNGIRINITKLQ
jgi:hypothetical protein